jgi:O-antigen/teichoic acid export membrane protein
LEYEVTWNEWGEARDEDGLRPLATGKKILKHSAVYTFGSFLEQSIGIILLPLYMRTLTPSEYGVVAQCRIASDFLALILSLGLYSGASRLYFDYRDNPSELKEFWGTVFSFLALVCGLGGLAISLWGEPLLGRIFDDVPYNPLMLIAVLTAAATPLYTTYLRTLQTRHQSLVFVILNSSKFIVSASLIVILVLVCGWKELGPVAGRAIVSGVYLLIVGVMLLREIKLCIRWRYLKRSLGFSLPVLPGALTTQASNVADQVVLSIMSGKEAVGLYRAGYQFGYVLSVVSIAVNSAFSPTFYEAMKMDDRTKLNELKRFSLYLTFGYCLFAAGLSFFAQELVAVFGSKEYLSCFVVIPCVAFVFVSKGIYMQLVATLTYYRETLAYCFYISLLQMVSNIVLNLLLVPRLGIKGAAWSALFSQIVATILTALVGHSRSKVAWEYSKYATLFAVALAGSLGINAVSWGSEWVAAPSKAIGFVGMGLALNWIAWRDPLFILRRGRRELLGLYEKMKQTRKEPIAAPVEPGDE